MPSKGPAFRIAELRQLYPEVVDLTISWTETGEGVPPEGRSASRSLRAGNLEGRIPCANPDCKKGGHDVTRLVKEVVDGRRTSGEAESVCAGYQGHRHVEDAESGPRKCENRMRLEVEVAYGKAARP